MDGAAGNTAFVTASLLSEGPDGPVVEGGPPAHVQPQHCQQDPLDPQSRFWTEREDERKQAGRPTSSSVRHLAGMERTGKYPILLSIMIELLDKKHRDDVDVDNTKAALSHLRSNSRKKSAGPRFWRDVALSSYLGAHGYRVDDVETAKSEVPMLLKNPACLEVAQHLAWFWERLQHPMQRSHGRLAVRDFDSIGRSLRLVWGAGVMQPGAFDRYEWGEREGQDVDCAFGVSATARDGDFHTRVEGEAMIDLKTHVGIRWGKILTGALLGGLFKDFVEAGDDTGDISDSEEAA